MNKRYVIVALFLLLPTLRCGEPESAGLCGTWRMVQGEYKGPELQVKQDEITRICYKILANDHFAVIEMFPDNPDSLFFAAIGTFQLNGDSYKEHYTASNVASKIGQTLAFYSEVKGDIWHIRLQTQEMSLSETWQRIQKL
ncbi:hypothetical protein JW992_01875 [candidate division KSB1 bacterium]|nr:hypothetical protein [candidate division KSB1 bacterium]